MEDIGAIVGTVLGNKIAKSNNPPPGSGIVPASEMLPDNANKVAMIQEEMKRAPNEQARQILQAELAKESGSGMGDIGSIVSQALTAKQEALQPAPVVQAPQAAKPVGEQPSGLMSAAAGAGKAVGTGALAIQQLAGKGASFIGDVADSDTVRKVGQWLQSDAKQGLQKLESENAPYAEANPKSNLAGEITGAVLSPVNKLVPGFGGPAATMGGAVIKGAAQGAILNTLTAPVTDESKPFLQEKVRQGAVGAIGGGVGAALGQAVASGLNKGIDALKGLGNKITANPGATDDLVTSALAKQGIEKASVPPELFDGLKVQVQEAIKSGKKVDPAALERLTRAETLPVRVPMLQGQLSRDAMQFAKEQNLRGIQGVGEPITQTLQAQNKALIANLDALGASKGTDVISAGKSVIDTLQSADAKAQQGVSAAYKAFKDATGKDLDVPLQGMAQSYAKTVSEFGDAIPSAVKNKFESLGLMSGKQNKVFSIEDAEGLIKSINKNFDPQNKVQARALNELRKGVQDAIGEAGQSAEGTAAASLAKTAREAAKARFSLIESTPALKDAIRGAEPDRFIQKYVLQGNQGEIKKMVETLGKEDPQALATLQDSVMRMIKDRVLNNVSSENAAFSQAQLKGFISDQNTSARLAQVLGPEKMVTLKQLNRVAEDVLYAPKAAAVNTSNTTSAAANLIKSEVQGGSLNRLLDLGKRVPGLSTASSFAQEGVQSKKASALIDEAVNPKLGKSQASKNQLADLARIGSRAGSAYEQSKTKRDRE